MMMGFISAAYVMGTIILFLLSSATNAHTHPAITTTAFVIPKTVSTKITTKNPSMFSSLDKSQQQQQQQQQQGRSLNNVVVSKMNMLPLSEDVSSVIVTTAAATATTTVPSSSLATFMLLAETEPWVQPLASVLDPFLNLFSFAMLCRVVISWYPTTNLNDVPFNIVVWPTEPLLRFIRGTVPPAFGVDITPIVWLGLFTFLHEILLGQQGLLTMKIKYGI